MYTNKTWLEQTYIKDGKTLQEIADMYNCSINTILKYMNKYSIPRRRRGPSPKAYPYIPKGWLHQKFVIEEMGIPEISRICGYPQRYVDTLLSYFGIEREQELYCNREWLHQRYIIDNMTSAQIAKEFGRKVYIIERWVIQHKLVDIKIDRKYRRPAGFLFKSYTGKTCPSCFRFLSWNCYVPHKNYPDGYSYKCRNCRKNGSPPITTVTKRYYVDKLGGGCAICGYNKCLAALVFHHVHKGTKKIDLYKRMVALPSPTTDKEVDKCVLLCANCHREIHNGMVNTAPVKNKGLGWTIP